MLNENGSLGREEFPGFEREVIAVLNDILRRVERIVSTAGDDDPELRKNACDLLEGCVEDFCGRIGDARARGVIAFEKSEFMWKAAYGRQKKFLTQIIGMSDKVPITPDNFEKMWELGFFDQNVKEPLREDQLSRQRILVLLDDDMSVRGELSLLIWIDRQGEIVDFFIERG